MSDSALRHALSDCQWTQRSTDVLRRCSLMDSPAASASVTPRTSTPSESALGAPVMTHVTTAAWQRDIKIQKGAVRAQPGDASGPAIRSWALGYLRHAGWRLDLVARRGETNETPEPVCQPGPPDLVVISRPDGVYKEHFRLRCEHWPPCVHPRV